MLKTSRVLCGDVFSCASSTSTSDRRNHIRGRMRRSFTPPCSCFPSVFTEFCFSPWSRNSCYTPSTHNGRKFLELVPTEELTSSDIVKTLLTELDSLSMREGIYLIPVTNLPINPR
jgi:SpoVK/Ycf46/Vps4 family AAA+-type ATPase